MSLLQYLGTDKFNLQQVVTPCIGSKKGFLTYRIIAFVIMFYGFILSLYNFNFNFNGVELKVYLPYFTNQTYICINIYFAVSFHFIFFKEKKIFKYINIHYF